MKAFCKLAQARQVKFSREMSRLRLSIASQRIGASTATGRPLASAGRRIGESAQATGKPAGLAARWLSVGRAASHDPHRLFGLPVGSGRDAIRRRYFELAKQTHPDTTKGGESGVGGESGSGTVDPAAAFVELHAAFEVLLRSASAATSVSDAQTSGASNSARGGGGAWARKGAAGARPFEPRSVSLAEVLALRLEEEPEALRSVWEEILSRQLEIDARAADALFRACSRTAPQGEAMAEALRLLRDATASGQLSGAHRSAALVSLLSWWVLATRMALYRWHGLLPRSNGETPRPTPHVSACRFRRSGRVSCQLTKRPCSLCTAQVQGGRAGQHVRALRRDHGGGPDARGARRPLHRLCRVRRRGSLVLKETFPRRVTFWLGSRREAVGPSLSRRCSRRSRRPFSSTTRGAASDAAHLS